MIINIIILIVIIIIIRKQMTMMVVAMMVMAAPRKMVRVKMMVLHVVCEMLMRMMARAGAPMTRRTPKARFL